MLSLMKQILKIVSLIIFASALALSAPTLAAGKAATKKAESDSHTPNFIEFPQMMSSVLDGYRVRGMMILGFGLEIEDSKLREKAQIMLPRLQDTYTREFNRYAGSLYRSGEFPDAEYISKQMQTATDRMLGEGNAVFLISNLMVRSQ